MTPTPDNATMPDEIYNLLMDYTRNGRPDVDRFIGAAKACGYVFTRADKPQAEDAIQALEIAENIFADFIEKRRVGGDYEERALETIRRALTQSQPDQEFLDEDDKMTDQKKDALLPCPIAEAMMETLSYFDEEFPLEKYPERESWYVSDHSRGLQVRQLRVVLEAWNTRAQPVADDAGGDAVAEWVKAQPHETYDGLKRQFYSLKCMLNSIGTQLSFYQKKSYETGEQHLAALQESLESERAMNAALTEELALRQPPTADKTGAEAVFQRRLDDQAIYRAMGAVAVEKTQDQLANDHDISSLLGVIADIRKAAGVKEKPMLYGLADAIKAEIDNRDKIINTTMAERDDNCDMADVLAHKLSQVLGVDIGEHSHLNDPWQNAIDYANALLTKSSAFVKSLEDKDDE